ncbi:MAG: hypothetical protein AAF387_18150 [Pseudomonadota bacterium]
MKTPAKKAPKARNYMARHPLLAKGGVHEKTAKAKRKAAKQALRREYPGEKLTHIGFFAWIFEIQDIAR